MRAIKITLLALIALVAAIYIAYCAQLWSLQRRMMFPGAQMDAVSDPGQWPSNARQLKLTDAQTVRAIWVPANTSSPASTIVFFHGNAEFAHESIAALSRLVGASRNVLLLEYPGYAGAPGEPTLVSIRDASLVAYDWLLQQPGVDPQRIAAFGRSVGGGPAAELSRHRPLAALVLGSTFTSIAEMARGLHVPAFLIRDPFDNRSAVSAFSGPVLILHGQHDDVIPYAYGVALGKASPRAEFIALRCAHNDCALDGTELSAAMTAFLDRHRL